MTAMQVAMGLAPRLNAPGRRRWGKARDRLAGAFEEAAEKPVGDSESDKSSQQSEGRKTPNKMCRTPVFLSPEQEKEIFGELLQ